MRSYLSTRNGNMQRNALVREVIDAVIAEGGATSIRELDMGVQSSSV